MEHKIYEYVGGENSLNIQYGTPFILIGFCGDVWELSKTNWNDVKHNAPAVIYRFDNLLVDISVRDEHFQKYFRYSCNVIQ
jgi:hypothetical protein